MNISEPRRIPQIQPQAVRCFEQKELLVMECDMGLIQHLSHIFAQERAGQGGFPDVGMGNQG